MPLKIFFSIVCFERNKLVYVFLKFNPLSFINNNYWHVFVVDKKAKVIIFSTKVINLKKALDLQSHRATDFSRESVTDTINYFTDWINFLETLVRSNPEYDQKLIIPLILFFKLSMYTLCLHCSSWQDGLKDDFQRHMSLKTE